MWKWFVGLAVLALGAALFFTLGPRDHGIERADYSTDAKASAVSAGMCAWRDPKRDMAALFPIATGYRAETFALGRHKVAIQRRLGPKYHMDSTALYVYRIEREGSIMGTVAVRRVAGPHGAIEVVAAVDPTGRIAGVRIQRQRELRTVADAISDPAWLTGFRGLSADSPNVLPESGRRLPDDATEAGHSVLSALRSLLVEMAESDQSSPPGSHDHDTHDSHP